MIGFEISFKKVPSFEGVPVFDVARRHDISVIAVKKYEDHVEIASDTQTTSNGTRRHPTRGLKLFQKDGIVVGIVGNAEVSTFLHLYFKEFSVPNLTLDDMQQFILNFYKFIQETSVDGYEFLEFGLAFASHDVAFIVDGYYVQEVVDFAAIGGGLSECFPLLHVGLSPVDAVVETCQLNIYCGFPVEEYHIYEKEIQSYVTEQ